MTATIHPITGKEVQDVEPWHERQHYQREDDNVVEFEVSDDDARFFKGIGFALLLTLIAGLILAAITWATGVLWAHWGSL
jgi:predicted cobalt transporter CbtA